MLDYATLVDIGQRLRADAPKCPTWGCTETMRLGWFLEQPRDHPTHVKATWTCPGHRSIVEVRRYPNVETVLCRLIWEDKRGQRTRRDLAEGRTPSTHLDDKPDAGVQAPAVETDPAERTAGNSG